MGYYLSKKDKESIVPLIEKMKRSGEDIEIKTQTPERLAYLLRNALNIEEEWKPLKDKWRIVVREGKIYLRIKAIQLGLNIDWVELVSPNFLELSSALFKNPEGVKVLSNVLNESEMFRVQRYCDNAGYKILVILPNTLEIKRDA